MLIPCVGGPGVARLVRYPPPLEFEAKDGIYVLVDEAAPESWRYEFIATRDTR